MMYHLTTEGIEQTHQKMQTTGMLARPCPFSQVVGCSGAVFGFMGLYVADMLLNFRSLTLPWLRLIWIAATLAYFVVASITQVGAAVC